MRVIDTITFKLQDDQEAKCHVTSSNGGTSYMLSIGVAGASRSSRSNLWVRSETAEEIPW
jgi:hypothetical protein